ncbi:MAG: DUF1302 domain-containing protein [Proteobacteria bacterium]|nr:DUF1302 domain-containing protein [Pseudomonadota bacterium]MBU1714497.1 DUF1302 domain-containing protein [Pseudomonadota bacterium]
MNATGKITIFLMLISYGLGQSAWGQGSDLDDILEGFDQPTEIPRTDSELDEAISGFATPQNGPDKSSVLPGEDSPFPMQSRLKISGGLTMGASYNFAHSQPLPGETDYRGLSRCRSALDLDADLTLPKKWQARIGGKVFYDFAYSIKGRDEYTAEVLKNYEDEIEFTEVYLQGALLKNLDLKAGRQIVVWGKSDNIRVTDLLNPLDNREPGVVDIRDLRLPVTMTKLDYYHGAWNISALMIHENRFNKDPVFGNDFYPGTTPAPVEEKLSTGIDHQEYGLAANGIFEGWDLSFYGASLYDDQPHREITPTGVKLRHSRISMAGSAVNIALGNWLLKAEAAWLSGLEYSVDVGPKSRLDILIGTEYTGFNETVISLELANRHIFDFDQQLEQAPVYGQEDELQYVLRLSHDFYHDTLQLTALLSSFGLTGDDGAFQRLNIKYNWSDAIAITTGIINYQNGNKTLFKNIEDNDRLFAEVRYSF